MPLGCPSVAFIAPRALLTMSRCPNTPGAWGEYLAVSCYSSAPTQQNWNILLAESFCCFHCAMWLETVFNIIDLWCHYFTLWDVCVISENMWTFFKDTKHKCPQKTDGMYSTANKLAQLFWKLCDNLLMRAVVFCPVGLIGSYRTLVSDDHWLNIWYLRHIKWETLRSHHLIAWIL